MEKRKCPRFPVMLPAVFFGERAGGGLVVDVSLEGCRHPERGAHAQRRLSTDPYRSHRRNPDRGPGRRPLVEEKEFGVELIRMASDQQARLRGFLNLFSHTPVGESPHHRPLRFSERPAP